MSLLLFAPGAGAPSSSPWMTAWAERLGQVGRVVRFDYAYQRAGNKRPDRLPALVDAHRAALEATRRDGEPAVLVGKSMGGRVGCHLSLTEPVAGLVCLGYPLVGQGAARPLRDEVLLALTTPVLFVQGTRDALAPLALLEQTIARMRAPAELLIVEGGDHSLEIRRRDGPQADADRRVLEAIRAFVARVAAEI
ncbi:MAG: alpha/beta fold hydrolase [Polyangiaceae bacterium]|nr:alpha/beta fold hydrolase [Polyangiaceae bacterium]